MKRKKEDYFVIALGLILVVVVSLIAIITSNFSSSSQPPNEESPSPSPTPREGATPTSEAETNTPPVLYDSAAQDRLIELVQNRQPLSDTDRLAKAKILSLLPPTTPSGVVYQTQNIIIDYTKSADLIQVEILTADIQAAKNEANLWLRTQGLSQEAICELPVGYYLNIYVANELRNTDIIFNPLGDGC